MAPWRWSRAKSDFDAEIESHLELEAERLVAEGWGGNEARWEARRRFGNVGRTRERFHHSRVPAWLDALLQDLRYASRQLARAPLFAAGVVLTLALGIGANAIVFGVVDRLLLRPPAHIASPDDVRLIFFRTHPAFESSDESTSAFTSYPLLTALRDQVPAFETVAAYTSMTATMGQGPDAEPVELSLVTGDYFQALGTRPELGRFFGPAEDAVSGGSPVAVVSHDFWRGRLGGTADVLGREVRVNGRMLTIVGVAPRDFTGAALADVDMWVPMSGHAAAIVGDNWSANSGFSWVRLLARLAPGVTVEQGESQATMATRRSIAGWNEPWHDSLTTVVTGSLIASRAPTGMPAEAKVTLWLFGVSGIVLLVACANVANLLLARATRRRREIAVRLALGVGWARLMRQLLTEIGLLGALSAFVAVSGAHWGGRVLWTLLLPDIARSGGAVDGRVLLFTLGVTLTTVLLAGLLPALQASSPTLTDALRAGARDGTPRRSQLGRGLLVAQTALSVALLVGAGLFVHSLQRMRGLDVGIDLPRVLLAQTNMDAAVVGDEQAAELWREGEQRVVSIPGVERVALLGGSIPTRSAYSMGVRLPGRDSLPRLARGGPYYAVVGADYLGVTGARVVEGRGLTEADESSGERVGVVNEHLASVYWPEDRAVGQCIVMGDDDVCTTIVGVVQNVMLFQMAGDERAMIYLPMNGMGVGRTAPEVLLVRIRDGAPASTAAAVQRELQRLAPTMSYVNVRSFQELVAPELRPWRLGATMFTLSGVLTLLIAAVGLYSVLAYGVSQRAQEIGVRVALGADRRDVVGLVVREGLGTAVVGVVAGLAIAIAAGPFIQPLLFDTSPKDPLVLGVAALSLLLVALMASLVPAWRAARVDPARALRKE